MGFLRRKQEPAAMIDLREPVAEPAPSAPEWGSPVPCPSCASRGYLDHIDPYREIMYLHCVECFTKYEISRAELTAGQAASA